MPLTLVLISTHIFKFTRKSEKIYGQKLYTHSQSPIDSPLPNSSHMKIYNTCNKHFIQHLNSVFIHRIFEVFLLTLTKKLVQKNVICHFIKKNF